MVVGKISGLDGRYRLASARKILNQRNIWQQKTREEIRRPGTGWVGESEKSWGASNQGVRCLTEEDQGMGGWKGASDRGASFNKTWLVGDIYQSGRKLDSRRPGTGGLGASERLGSEHLGESDWGARNQ